MPHFYTEPVISILARPAFVGCFAHLPVQWLGESTDGERLAEFAGRLCYMSQKNPANRATREYLENIKKQGHGSVLEHANYSLLIEGVSRSLTHELVRHRAGFAYSQLSQRYVDESNAAFVVPPAILGDEALLAQWKEQMETAPGNVRLACRKTDGALRLGRGTGCTAARWRVRPPVEFCRTPPKRKSSSLRMRAHGARWSNCGRARARSSRFGGWRFRC